MWCVYFWLLYVFVLLFWCLLVWVYGYCGGLYWLVLVVIVIVCLDVSVFVVVVLVVMDWLCVCCWWWLGCSYGFVCCRFLMWYFMFFSGFDLVMCCCWLLIVWLYVLVMGLVCGDGEVGWVCCWFWFVGGLDWWFCLCRLGWVVVGLDVLFVFCWCSGCCRVVFGLICYWCVGLCVLFGLFIVCCVWILLYWDVVIGLCCCYVLRCSSGFVVELLYVVCYVSRFVWCFCSLFVGLVYLDGVIRWCLGWWWCLVWLDCVRWLCVG